MALFRRKQRESYSAPAGMSYRTTDVTDCISVHDALSIFYYLMSADGTLHEDELEKFGAIYNELGGPEYLNQQILIHNCQKRLEESTGSDNPLISALACVDRVLYEPSWFDDQETSVSPRLLVWDLLAIAYSDGSCHALERELVGHIAKIVGVEETLVLEMESSVLTLLDLDNEVAWIKTTNQPYVIIESVLKDLETRKAAVFDGIEALITL